MFGRLPSGEAVEAWTLTGTGRLTLETITYGGIVTRLLVPDRDGHIADVVLGFQELAPYLTDRHYFGAIVGRVAGRISAARFRMQDRVYDLAANDPPNHLHGGVRGFDKVIWTANPVQRLDGAPSLRLSRRSPDGEEGYPGNVDVSVTYTVTHRNEFLIETEAVTDKPTPFSLTSHSYFNLAGEDSGSVCEHELEIQADEFVPVDHRGTLLGRLEPVIAQGNDFRIPRRMGDAIPRLFQNHGDLYRLCGRAPVARFVHPGTGRVLEVFNTASYLQMYTAAAFDGSLRGKAGVAYPRHAAVCLECQDYPDGANVPALGDIILRPGAPWRQTTRYAFSVEPICGKSREHTYSCAERRNL
jgi:aldose 1-epimerase